MSYIMGLTKEAYYKAKYQRYKNTDAFKAKALYRKLHPELDLLSQAKFRAKKAGLPFDLLIEDIKIPNVCPILGIKIQKNPKGNSPWPHSPSVDRLIPKLGYVKSNIRIISHRANTLKSDGTAAEFEAILSDVRFLEKYYHNGQEL